MAEYPGKAAGIVQLIQAEINFMQAGSQLILAAGFIFNDLTRYLDDSGDNRDGTTPGCGCVTSR